MTSIISFPPPQYSSQKANPYMCPLIAPRCYIHLRWRFYMVVPPRFDLGSVGHEYHAFPEVRPSEFEWRLNFWVLVQKAIKVEQIWRTLASVGLSATPIWRDLLLPSPIQSRVTPYCLTHHITFCFAAVTPHPS